MKFNGKPLNFKNYIFIFVAMHNCRCAFLSELYNEQHSRCCTVQLPAKNTSRTSPLLLSAYDK
ncbi:hypothetical protein, partial [Ruminococcus flavefaciens]|uniref:hypothetical protein n=1 Tax=Ruminococcus flavefaciens TaxID=1265 RepID=UPI0019D3BBB9